MIDPWIHAALFLLVSAVIVCLGVCFVERDDGRALRIFPRRFLVFVFGCALFASLMLLCEHTLAKV